MVMPQLLYTQVSFTQLTTLTEQVGTLSVASSQGLLGSDVF